MAALLYHNPSAPPPTNPADTPEAALALIRHHLGPHLQHSIQSYHDSIAPCLDPMKEEIDALAEELATPPDQRETRSTDELLEREIDELERQATMLLLERFDSAQTWRAVMEPYVNALSRRAQSHDQDQVNVKFNGRLRVQHEDPDQPQNPDLPKILGKRPEPDDPTSVKVEPESKRAKTDPLPMNQRFSFCIASDSWPSTEYGLL